MSFCKLITVRINSNVNNYQIALYDCDKYVVKRINKQNDILCFYTDCPCLKVFVSPLQKGYANKYYFKLDTTITNTFNLCVNFPPKPVYSERVYTFYLTDGTYGLKVNGSLNFTHNPFYQRSNF